MYIIHVSVDLSSQGSDQTVVIDTNLGSPMGLAVDWLHNRLYWTDPERDLIESSALDGSLRSVVVYRGLDKPRDIVVDPERG